jgi:SAM-dependent methyltransferase
MLIKLKRIYMNQMYFPSLFGILINPYYFIRKGLFKGVLLNKNYLKGRLLDFGCGNKPYRKLFDVKEYVGVDIKESGHSHKNEQIDVFYDGKTIPFGDNQFDCIFSAEVFEHIFNLEHILKELHRVLKPGGHLLITLPFVWEEHEIPYDYARYTSFGINNLLTRNGFEVINLEKTTNFIETVVQMWNSYVYQYLFPSNIFLKVLMVPLFIAPSTIFGIIFSKILPKSKTFYLNNIVVAQKANLRNSY